MKIAVFAAIFVGVASAILPAGAQVDAQVQLAAAASNVDSAQVSQMIQRYEALHSDLDNEGENFGGG
jgi:hypothetical protein